ncbi:hypothetical protein YC2023_048176 [Brassica napus]
MEVRMVIQRRKVVSKTFESGAQLKNAVAKKKVTSRFRIESNAFRTGYVTEQNLVWYCDCSLSVHE